MDASVSREKPKPAKSSAARKPFENDDLYLHLKITDLHCTAHQERVACAVKSLEREKNDYLSKIWTFAFDGSAAVQMTQGPGNDHTPRWSADGSQLAFISDRGGAAQVYLLPCQGGEARQLTHIPGGVSSVRWRPDGSKLIVAATVEVDADLLGKRSSEPAPKRECAVEVAWRLPYKSDGKGYLLSREIHLFSVDVQTGKHVQLSDGPFDVMDHDISPDGKEIAYVRTREGRFAHATDLWTCGVDGTHHRRLTDSHAMVMGPVWSPDKCFIAFTGAVLEGDAESRLWLLDLASGKTRQLGDVETSTSARVQWSDDGKSVVFVRAHRGRHQVVRMDLDGNTDVLLDRDHQIGSFGCSGKHFALTVHHPSLPSELHACRSEDAESSLCQISDLNPWWKERTAIETRAVQFKVPDAKGGFEEIEGWLLRAKGESGPLPLLNDIHGGPASYAQLDFDTNVYWQVLCSQGWAILTLNAVGSSSFGRDFCHRLEGHWGTYDLPQHLAAIDQLQAEGLCDDRVAVCGKSYGGYLACWATGHTQRFKAAVVMAPVGNIETHYGTSDGGYYADPFSMSTAPQLDREKARELSPLQYVEKSKTPTLFMQGKEDERCPKCQSEELFVSLMRAGETPTQLVLYPGESHAFLASGTPACRADAARRIVDWVKSHCGDSEAAFGT